MSPTSQHQFKPKVSLSLNALEHKIKEKEITKNVTYQKLI